MCGIIGYVGRRECTPLLLQGLRRLEYRGYDSAGIATREQAELRAVRAVGPLENLELELLAQTSSSQHGIAHTRWATHGRATVANAHPLGGCTDGEIAIVLNGIVENYQALRATLRADGHLFHSETDAEVVAHLVERHLEGDLTAAVRAAFDELEGHFAFVVLHRAHPGVLVAARRDCPLVVGHADGEAFVASNVAALGGEVAAVRFPDDDDVVTVTAGSVTFSRPDGTAVERPLVELAREDELTDRGRHRTHLLKEILEQPAAVAATLAGGSALDDDELLALDRIAIVSAGSSYHAGLVARYAIEAWAGIPVEVEIASEWLYRDSILGPRTLVLGISQSGETRDTISALKLAAARGARTVALTNVAGSQITRHADLVLHTRAGLEVSVAASKTFTTQVALLFALALRLAELRNGLAGPELQALRSELDRLPATMAVFLERDNPIDEIARAHVASPFFLYLGRHLGLPVALEGALKLKEIAYVPTDAYAAGEMKHGPIALLAEGTPVVAVATDSHVYDKLVSNLQEARARGAQIVAIATEGNEEIQYHADDVVYVPQTHPFLQAPLAVLPLQLLAHRIAELRTLDVDRPRNLAKTVTVE